MVGGLSRHTEGTAAQPAGGRSVARKLNPRNGGPLRNVDGGAEAAKLNAGLNLANWPAPISKTNNNDFSLRTASLHCGTRVLNATSNYDCGFASPLTRSREHRRYRCMDR